MSADPVSPPPAGARPRPGLGRGLDALLGDAPRARQGSGSGAGGETQRLPIAFLRPNPDQPRRSFDEAALEELAQSIGARGLLQPILVRPRGRDLYEIVAGERRWRAAQRAGLHDVPVVVRDFSDSETAEIALVENVQRVDLNPVEEAEAYRLLVKSYGRSQDDIARAVGKSRSHVANLMRLLSLPPKTLEALRAGDISMGHARALLGGPSPDKLLGEVVRLGLSVRQTEKLVQQLNAPRDAADKKGATSAPAPTAAAAPHKDADVRALEADLAAALGLEVEIAHGSGGGALTIRYRDLDQLDDVCKRLMAAGV